MPGPGRSGLLRELREDGSPAGPPMPVDDLAVAVLEHEHNAEPRWVWPSAALVYQRLLRAGVGVARCHDVALADALISGRDAALGQSAGEASPGQVGAGEASLSRAALARARPIRARARRAQA